MGDVFELGTDGPTSILVGVDGSDTSMRAGAYAAGLARRQGARLIVVYVAVTTSVAANTAATAGVMIEVQDQIAQEIETTIAERAEHIGVPVEFVRRAGNPYRELIAVAEDRRVDAIVVGASMQAGHRLVGSLAGRLVRDAAWPITVVP